VSAVDDADIADETVEDLVERAAVLQAAQRPGQPGAAVTALPPWSSPW
jgi:hypothetical protein